MGLFKNNIIMFLKKPDLEEGSFILVILSESPL